MEYTIVTYGAGEILNTLFNALAALLNSKTGSIYQPLVRIGLTLGVFWGLASTVYGDKAKFIKGWLIPFYAILSLFLAPTCKVHIKDPTTHQPPYTVDNVPWGLGAFAGSISKLGDIITRKIEAAFSLPDDLKYHKTGSVFASNLIAESKVFHITNTDLQETMREFVNQCVIYDALIGRKYTINDLKNSDDIWSLVTENPSPARSFNFKHPGKDQRSQIVTCREGVALLREYIEREAETAFQYFGNKIFGYREDERHRGTNILNPSAELKKYLPIAFSYMTNMAKEASEIMKQQMMIFSVIDAVESKSESLGNAANFAVKRAYLQERANQETLAGVAAQKLVAMKNVMEALIYAAFIFILPMALLPSGWSFISRWIGLVLWVQLWPPLYAVLNFIMNEASKSKGIGMVTLQGSNGVTIANSVGFMNLHADMAAQAGFLSIAVGSLAYALVRGGAASFVHLANHLGSPSIQAAGRAAEDLVAGNYSFGNVSEGSVQAYNSSFGQHQWSPSYSSGSFTQNDGVVSRTTSVDGTQLINVASSQLRSSVSLNESMSNSYTESANQALTASQNELVAETQSTSEAYRRTFDLAAHQAKNQSSGESFSDTHSSSTQLALNTINTAAEKFAQAHDISKDQSSQLLASASLSANAGAGLEAFGSGASVKGSMGLTTQNISTASDRGLSSKAIDFVKQNGLQETLSTAANAVAEGRYSTSDEAGQRYVEGISSSWDQVQSHRAEASAQLQKAETYSKAASYIKQNAASINANLNQEYVGWLAKQSLPNSRGEMGIREAETILSSNPSLDMAYQKKFIEEKIPSLPNYLQEASFSPEKIQDSFGSSENNLRSGKSGSLSETARVQANHQGFGESFKPKEQARKNVDDSLGKAGLQLSEENVNLAEKEHNWKEALKKL